MHFNNNLFLLFFYMYCSIGDGAKSDTFRVFREISVLGPRSLKCVSDRQLVLRRNQLGWFLPNFHHLCEIGRSRCRRGLKVFKYNLIFNIPTTFNESKTPSAKKQPFKKCNVLSVILASLHCTGWQQCKNVVGIHLISITLTWRPV